MDNLVPVDHDRIVAIVGKVAVGSSAVPFGRRGKLAYKVSAKIKNTDLAGLFDVVGIHHAIAVGTYDRTAPPGIMDGKAAHRLTLFGILYNHRIHTRSQGLELRRVCKNSIGLIGFDNTILEGCAASFCIH